MRARGLGMADFLMGDVPKTPLYRLRRWWYYNEDRVLKVFCTLVTIWLVAMLLQGCASMDYVWRQARPASVKPWLYVYALDVDAACRMVGAQAKTGQRINGCAQWKPVGCVIFLPESAPRWIVEHEERHCQGWSH